MPEYLAPGVYIEETSFRQKTIEGVSTSTAGFVGPACFGPTKGVPELLTSFADFQRIYGGIDKLEYSEKMDNYLAHAVRAFFENGGKRLYVSRVYDSGNNSDGCATYDINNGSIPDIITLKARYPGAAGNMTVTFVFQIGQNILINENGTRALQGASAHDLVLVKDLESPIRSPPGKGTLYWLERHIDTKRQKTFRFQQTAEAENDAPILTETDTSASTYIDLSDVRIVTVNVTVELAGDFPNSQIWEDLAFHPEHKQSLGKVFAQDPPDRSTALYVPLVFKTELTSGVDIAQTLLNQQSLTDESQTFFDYLLADNTGESSMTYRVVLGEVTEGIKGSDGIRPDADKYQGEESNGLKSGLMSFEDIENISIVAAPGSSYSNNKKYKDTETISGDLKNHCERMRYRIAVLDSIEHHLVSDVLQYRAKMDSKHAALYYPWVTILDPVTGDEINLPPSGFVAGIYARNDVEYGVHKAPANEIVNLAIDFEFRLNKAQQDVLNPKGINCFRFFEGRGYRLWGARTISSDPEWKYVNLRRYFAFLERSIEKGTQWVVFENNNERLWSNVRLTIEDFLYNEWKSNHLMGEDPKKAYFVRCDRSTMTQNDIDNGRLICLIGVAPVRPAEFVIFRIGQWTAERRV
jgi:phage tail sheath protein FI